MKTVWIAVILGASIVVACAVWVAHQIGFRDGYELGTNALVSSIQVNADALIQDDAQAAQELMGRGFLGNVLYLRGTMPINKLLEGPSGLSLCIVARKRGAVLAKIHEHEEMKRVVNNFLAQVEEHSRGKFVVNAPIPIPGADPGPYDLCK